MRSLVMEALSRSPRGTQSKIADAMGVRPSTVNKWAKGYNLPEPERWPQLEELLGLPAGSLAEASGLGAALGLAERVSTLEVQLRSLAAAVRRLAGELDADDEPLPDAIPDGPASGEARR